MRVRFGIAVIVLTALTLAAAGCQKHVPVQGSVTLDGKPLDRATITFLPHSGGHPSAGIVQNGRFGLQTGTKERVRPGRYRVVISRLNPGDSHVRGGKETIPETLPPAYSSTVRTTLTCDVPSGGTKNVLFELDSKATVPPAGNGGP